MSSVRSPAVAGRFYPADPGALRADVRRFLEEGLLDPGSPRRGAAGRAGAVASPQAPVAALVAPHAGFRYSGPVAGSAWAALRRSGRTPRSVVLIGPAHHRSVRGLAVPTADAFRTPLGDVPVDPVGMARALDHPCVLEDEDAHAPEHALETQLPFLQEVAPDVPIVPLLVGHASREEVVGALDAVWDEGAVVVVSSDLSHYLPHEQARSRDSRTARAVESLDVDGVGPDDACGWLPLRGLLAAARDRGLEARTLDLRTSGDTAGPRDRVVGYGAFALTARPAGPDAPGATRG